MRVYAIGDIHGQLGMLEAAHARIAEDRARVGDFEAPVVHLGDLVDRGPDSRGVIQFLIDGLAGGAPWIVIKGNHDQCFAAQIGVDRSLLAAYRSWTSSNMGGAATAESYGVTSNLFHGFPSEARARQRLSDAVPEAHKVFLGRLRLYYETDDLIFVHAGIRPGLPMTDQIEEDLLWIRHEFLGDPRDHGKLIVHGHTAVEAPVHCGNRVNLDSGAGYNRPLTAAVFENRDVWILGETGREALLPD